MKFLKNFMDSLHLNDDDEDDDEDYEEYFAQASARERKRTERQEKKERENARTSKSSYDEDDEEDIEERAKAGMTGYSSSENRRGRSTSTERPSSSGKVVPFRGNPVNIMEIQVIKPTVFNDARVICDVLLSGKSTIINLEGFNTNEAQRVMDFVNGAVYAVNAKVIPITGSIFVLSPDGVEVRGDYKQQVQDVIKKTGFDAYAVNRDF